MLREVDDEPGAGGESVVLPTAPAAPAAPGVPWIGVLAPLAISGVLWLVGSPFVLLFALLSPVVALAGWLDGRHQRRRDSARQRVEHEEALAAAMARIDDAVGRELARALAAHPPPGCGALGRWPPVVGRADRMSAVRIVGEGVPAPVLARAPVVAALPSNAVLRVEGPAVLAESAARALAVQAVEGLPGAVVELAASWAGGAGDRTRIRAGAGSAATASAIEIVVGDERAVSDAHGVLRVDGVLRASWNGQPVEPVLAGADVLAALTPPRTALPADVPLSALQHGPDAGSIAIGVAARAHGDASTVRVDLVRDGPHAVIAGSTGSGKSELLLAWVGALLARVPPTRLGVLLIDFKGGTTFQRLAHAPHCVGLVTDLDADGAERAVLSLGAEIRRRERTLRDTGARELDDRVLPRLLVVVDEYAAMLGELPALEAVFADLASRGRALGVHLLLATQRPVADRVLANASIRILFRSPVDADARTLLGSAAAPGPVPGSGLGRPGAARIRIGDAPVIAFQAARVDTPPSPLPGPPPRRPWVDPLPDLLDPAETARWVEPTGADAVIGLVDDPAAQRRLPLAWRPDRGALLVLGAAGSGRTTALDAVAAALEAPVVADAEALWDALDAVQHGGPLLVDDLDAMLGALAPDAVGTVVDRLAAAMRDRPVAVTARRPIDLGRLAALCGDTLLLRSASLADHLAAGGAATGWTPMLPRGAGWWQGRRAQVHAPVPPAPRIRSDPPPLLPDGPVVIVAARPNAVTAALARVDPGAAETHIAGTPEDWQQRWPRFRELAAAMPVVFAGVSASDVRMLAPRAGTAPALCGPDRCWLLPVDGVLERRRLPSIAPDAVGG